MTDDFSALLHQAGIAGQAGRLNEAAQWLESAAAADPSSAVAFDNLAVMLAQLGHLDAALVSHQRAIELTPDYPAKFINAGVTLCRLERYAEALARFERAAVLDPGSPERSFPSRDSVAAVGALRRGAEPL